MGEKLIFKYDQVGNMEIDAQGFKGTACETATKKFLDARRFAQKASDVKKPEYYQQGGISGGLKTGI